MCRIAAAMEQRTSFIVASPTAAQKSAFGEKRRTANSSPKPTACAHRCLEMMEETSGTRRITAGGDNIYGFSPDGKHIVHFSNQPNAGAANLGLSLDDKYIPLPLPAFNYFNLTFSPDSKHLFWLHKAGDFQTFLIYMDGKPAVEAFPIGGKCRQARGR
jgi:hypothetical protein